MLSNSILAASLILQEALNASTFSWQIVVYDAVEGVRNYLSSGSPEHHFPLVKVSKMFEARLPFAQSCGPSNSSKERRVDDEGEEWSIS